MRPTPNDLSCPSKTVYQGLLEGRIDEVEAAALLEHLESCRDCEQTVRSFEADEPTFAAPDVRRSGGDGELPAEYLQAIENLKSWSTGRGAGGDPDVVSAYRLLEVIGRGGMGVVYRARHIHLDKTVAVKLMSGPFVVDAAARSRFQREMRAVGRLDHPHIVRALDAGEANGHYYLAMEYAEGRDAASLLTADVPLSIADACEIVRQAAIGMDYAHSRGLIHRDLKPSNLMLSIAPDQARQQSRVVVKILDLGLALLDESDGELTTSGQIMGSVNYMAPEQVTNSRTVDARADVYSLGATLYKLLCGQAPVSFSSGDSPLEKLAAIQSRTPSPVTDVRPEVPVALAALLDRMLAKSPDDRPPTPGEVARQLAGFCDGADLHSLVHGTSDDPATGPKPVAKKIEDRPDAPCRKLKREQRPARRPLVAAAIACGLAGVMLLAVLFTLKTPRGTVAISLGEGVSAGDVEIEVKKGDQLHVIDKDDNWKIELADGQWKVRLKRGNDRFAVDKQSISVRRGGKEFVTISLREARHVAATPDRSAAAYVLSIGGRVEVDGVGVSQLPDAPFRLTGVELTARATDDGLKVFRNCKHLTSLKTRGPVSISDAGVASFADCKQLVALYLLETSVTDKGLAAFADCSRLRDLRISSKSITDAGLVHFAGCPLQTLALHGSHFTDKGLETFGDCELETLWLGTPEVTDKGLAHLRSCRNLKGLMFDNVAVTDRGAGHFKTCKQLTTLRLQGTRVTDAGLALFADNVHLTTLDVGNSPISDASVTTVLSFGRLSHVNLEEARFSARGYQQIRVAFPDAKIGWSEPNRRAATSVLAAGGAVYIARPEAETSEEVRSASDLPNHFFQIRRADLTGAERLVGGDAPLATLTALQDEKWDRLEALDLAESSLSNELLAALKRLPRLQELSLAKTRVTDHGLSHLKSIKTLRNLNLDGCNIRGPGLAQLESLPRLTELRLGCPTMTDTFMPSLGKLRSLRRLSLAGAAVSDDGLKHLASLRNLVELDVRETGVTSAGVANLRKSLPEVQVESGKSTE